MKLIKYTGIAIYSTVMTVGSIAYDFMRMFTVERD